MSTQEHNQHTPAKKTSWSVKGLDILGTKFSLSFKRSSGKFQTQLGGYITLAVSFISIASFIFIMSQYFNRDSPVVTTSTEFGSKITQFNLYEEKLYSPMNLAQGPTTIHPSQTTRYMTLVANIDQVAFSFATNRFEGGLQKQVPFIPCDSVTDPKVKEVLFDIVPLESFQQIMLCPNFTGRAEDYYAKNNITREHIYRTISIKVYPCSLPDSSLCATPAEMVMLQIEFGRRRRLLVSSNFTNPVKDIIYKDEIRIDPKATKIFKHEIKKNKILDDTIQFVSANVNTEYGSSHLVSSDFQLRDPSQFHCSKAQIGMGLMGGCQEYITLNYLASGEVNVIRRNYKKFTTMLGEFGGLLKILTTVVFFLYSFYNFRRVKSYLALGLLNLDKKTFQSVKKLIDGGKGAREGKPRSRDPFGGEERGQEAALPQPRSAKVKGEGQAVSCEDAVKDCLESRCSVVDMMSKLNTVELIEDALLTEHEKKLIPLVLMVTRTKKQQKIEKNSKNEEILNYGGLMLNWGDCKKKNNPSKSKFESKAGAWHRENQAVFLESYEGFLAQQPKNDFSRTLREYMIRHLEPLYEGNGVNNKQKGEEFDPFDNDDEANFRAEQAYKPSEFRPKSRQNRNQAIIGGGYRSTKIRDKKFVNLVEGVKNTKTFQTEVDSPSTATLHMKHRRIN